MTHVPLVSVIVPCRNEKDHIEVCLRSLLAQKPLPGGIEIMVIDGMSNDGTQNILTRLAGEDSRFIVIKNPSRTTPIALNIGIQASRGQYIAILGAHAEYAPDYLKTCVDLFQEHPEVCCVGGPIISQGKAPFGQAVAEAMSHPVGVGNAKHRLPHYEGYAEGACFPMFRKEIFDKVGLFDEHLIITEDDELNYRLARHGEKIFISPRARCTYFVRETPSRLFGQYFRYGYWRVAVLRKHRRPASVRQIVPPMAMSLMCVTGLLALSLPGWWRLSAGVLPAFYGSTLLIVGASKVRKAGWHVACLLPVAAAIMHAAYTAGFASAFLEGTNRMNQEVSSHKRGYHTARD
jgi:glycosyltransferase involved in cell wall biosynthesis